MKIHSRIYLLSAFFCFFICLMFAYHTIPLFIKWFVPFPTLEQATIYEGKLHIDKRKETYRSSRRSVFSSSAASYYIIDRQGESHSIFFGYLGGKRDEYATSYEGMQIKAWFHPVFGVIHEEAYAPEAVIKIIPKYDGVDIGIKHGDKKDYFNNHFYEFADKYYWSGWTSIILLMMSVYYLRKSLKNKVKAE